MTAEANNPALDDELNTTAPQSNPAEWKMPEPVFRRTSGKLPKGFEKQFAPTPTGEHEASSQPSEDAVEAYVEPEPKNPTLKILVVALALIGMAAFIVAFLTVVYFIFLRSPD